MVTYILTIFRNNPVRRVKIRSYKEEKSILMGRVNDSISNVAV
jgi:hypothetical protein